MNQPKGGESYLKLHNESKTIARICNLRLSVLNPKKTEGGLTLVLVSVDCLLGLNCPSVWQFEKKKHWPQSLAATSTKSFSLFSYCYIWSWCRRWWCLLRARSQGTLQPSLIWNFEHSVYPDCLAGERAEPSHHQTGLTPPTPPSWGHCSPVYISKAT